MITVYTYQDFQKQGRLGFAQAVTLYGCLGQMPHPPSITEGKKNPIISKEQNTFFITVKERWSVWKILTCVLRVPTAGSSWLKFEWEGAKEREGRVRFMERLGWGTDLKEIGFNIRMYNAWNGTRETAMSGGCRHFFPMWNLQQYLQYFILVL